MDVTMWMFVIATFSAVLGFLLNSFVITVRIVKRRTMTTFQLLLAVIAFNDLFLSILFGLIAALMHHHFQWIYHPSACKILFPAVTTFMSVNVGCMFLVSYERFRAIIYPFKPRISIKRTLKVVALIWIASTFCIIPNIIALRIQPYGECRESWGNEVTPKVYSLCLLVLVYVLPLSFIIAMHVSIGLRLHKISKRLVDFRSGAARLSRQKLNRSMRTVKLLALIVAAFSVFVLPTKVYYLIWDFAPDLVTERVHIILEGYKSLYYIHVIVNPILYSLTNAQFRKDICDVMQCRVVNTKEHTSGLAINLSPMTGPRGIAKCN